MFGINFGPVLRQYIAVIVANFTFLQLGMTAAWLSPLLVQLRDASQTPLSQPITDEQGAWIVSIGFLVGLTALFYNGYVADRLGRKYSIILATIPRLIMFLLFIFATDIWMMLLGRAFCGISDVFVCSVTSTYTSEIASKEIRGGLGTIAQILSALGAMALYGIGPFLTYFTLLTILTCVVFITFVPLFFLPESPYSLYSAGRIAESTKVLSKLRRKSVIQEELKEYAANVNIKVNKLDKLKDIIVLKTVARVIIIAVGTQMTGISAVLFYLQTVFESTRTSVSPEISSLIIGCIQLVGCTCNIIVMDRFGRKPILNISLIGMIIGTIGLGTFFQMRNDHFEITGFLNYLPLISVILTIFSYNAGIGSIVWTLMAELFDGPSRAVGVSIGVFASTLFTFLTTRYMAEVSQALGPAGSYWVFAGCSIVMCLFLNFCIPETKGKTFSEIQASLGRKSDMVENIGANPEKTDKEKTINI